MEKNFVMNDMAVRNLKPEEKEFTRREKGGFGVRVHPSGTKTLFFLYRVAGQRKFLNLGEYYEPKHKGEPKGKRVSLAEAREVYETEKKKVELFIKGQGGADPVAVKDMARLQQLESKKAHTVAELAKEYMEKHAKPNKKTWKRDEFCLNNDVLPTIGKAKAENINKRDLILLLEKIVERGAPGQARTVLEVLRRMFTFAVERDILETSPMFGVKPLTKRVAKDRVLTADEIKTLWSGLDTAGISDEIKRALKLIFLTGARPGEVIGMHSSEIDGDWWQIPADRSKNGIVHRVFLTPTAKEMIGPLEIRDEKTGEMKGKGYIFASPRPDIDPVTEKAIPKPIDVNALAYAIRRNLKDYKRQRPARKATDSDTPSMVPVPDNKKIDMQPFTPHDLRRTAATMLAELGYSNEIIDAVLGHKARGVVAVYNRHDYNKEKQKAMEALERKIISITTGKKGKVISIVEGNKASNE